jgi:hypothetical protein
MGFRLGEWSQEASKSEIASYQLNRRNEAQVICLRDVRFLESAARGQYSAVASDAATNTTMVKCSNKFRNQKNGQNGETSCLSAIARASASLALYSPLVEGIVGGLIGGLVNVFVSWLVGGRIGGLVGGLVGGIVRVLVSWLSQRS